MEETQWRAMGLPRHLWNVAKDKINDKTFAINEHGWDNVVYDGRGCLAWNGSDVLKAHSTVFVVRDGAHECGCDKWSRLSMCWSLKRIKWMLR